MRPSALAAVPLERVVVPSGTPARVVVEGVKKAAAYPPSVVPQSAQSIRVGQSPSTSSRTHLLPSLGETGVDAAAARFAAHGETAEATGLDGEAEVDSYDAVEDRVSHLLLRAAPLHRDRGYLDRASQQQPQRQQQRPSQFPELHQRSHQHASLPNSSPHPHHQLPIAVQQQQHALPFRGTPLAAGVLPSTQHRGLTGNGGGGGGGGMLAARLRTALNGASAAAAVASAAAPPSPSLPTPSSPSHPSSSAAVVAAAGTAAGIAAADAMVLEAMRGGEGGDTIVMGTGADGDPFKQQQQQQHWGNYYQSASALPHVQTPSHPHRGHPPATISRVLVETFDRPEGVTDSGSGDGEGSFVVAGGVADRRRVGGGNASDSEARTIFLQGSREPYPPQQQQQQQQATPNRLHASAAHTAPALSQQQWPSYPPAQFGLAVQGAGASFPGGGASSGKGTINRGGYLPGGLINNSTAPNSGGGAAAAAAGGVRLKLVPRPGAAAAAALRHAATSTPSAPAASSSLSLPGHPGPAAPFPTVSVGPVDSRSSRADSASASESQRPNAPPATTSAAASAATAAAPLFSSAVSIASGAAKSVVRPRLEPRKQQLQQQPTYSVGSASSGDASSAAPPTTPASRGKGGFVGSENSISSTGSMMHTEAHPGVGVRSHLQQQQFQSIPAVVLATVPRPHRRTAAVA